MNISVSWSRPGEFENPLSWIADASLGSGKGYAFWKVVMFGFGLFVCFHHRV